MKSVYDLSVDYINNAYPDVELPISERRAIIKEINTYLDDGCTTDEIEKAIALIKRCDNEAALGKLLNSSLLERPKYGKNLLSSGKFYYHNELRIMPGPPIINIDYNTGEITRTQEEHFLEMKASYTIDNLYDYYCKQMLSDAPEGSQGRFKGILRWIVKNHGIDIALFMIDVAANHVSSEDLRPPTTPLYIVDFVDMAHKVYNHKVTETKTMGEDKIEPKRRILSSRRRSVATKGIHQECNLPYY